MNTDYAMQKQKGDTENREHGTRRPRLHPVYEVWEEKDAIRLRVEMPGLRQEDISITVENNRLMITGSRPDWNVEGTILLRERRVGDYYREFTLDRTVDTEGISATMKNGVLDITLGIAKEAQPRRIEIKSS